jgi:hypothetical protein
MMKTGKCRCNYPMRIRIGDDGLGNRLLFCGKHGFKIIPTGIIVSRDNFTPKIQVPTRDEWIKWVADESKRMRRRITKGIRPDKTKALARLDKIDREMGKLTGGVK